MSIVDLQNIEKSLKSILYLKDKLELTISLREKEILIEGIVGHILNIQDILKK